jgi:gas vesicle protein
MSHDSGSSLVTFVMGIAVGAVVAALYAPTSGAALRRRLSRAAGEGADMAHDAFEQADDFVQDKKKTARKFVNRASDAFQKARDEATNAE